MTLRVARFIEANRVHAIEYFSAEGLSVTVRLVDGTRWQMKAREFRELDSVNWMHREDCFA